MKRSRMSRPGIMNRYARGASRSQKRALPRGCGTISTSVLGSAVITLINCSVTKMLRPGSRQRTLWDGPGCPGGGAARPGHEKRLRSVDALQLRLGLLYGARRIAGLDRRRNQIDDD